MKDFLKENYFEEIADVFKFYNLKTPTLDYKLYLRHLDHNLGSNNKEIPKFEYKKIKNFEMKLSPTEFLQKCTEKLNQNNVNYKKKMFKCKEPFNTMHLNVFLRQREFFDIYNLLGDELSFYLITEFIIIYNINDKFILLTGRLNDIELQQTNQRCLKMKLKNLKTKDFIEQIKSINFFNDNHPFLQLYNQRILKKLTKIKFNGIFESICKKEKNNDLDPLENKFKANAIKNEKIILFLFVIAKKIITTEFGFKNMCILKNKIKMFINILKYESIPKTELLRGFKISEIKFLSVFCSKTETIKQKMIFEDFIFNLFEQICIPLINVYFYCTETSFSGNKYFYYRKDFWHGESRKFLEKYLAHYQLVCSDENLKTLEEENNTYVAQDKLNISFPLVTNKYKKSVNRNKWSCYNKKCITIPTIRCIPKKNDLRPICNHSFKNDNETSKNSIFRILKQILQFEVSKSMVNSDLNKHNLFQKLFEYGNQNKDQMIYLLKMDIKGCFDNFSHDELLKNIDGIFSQDTYFLKSYGIYKCGKYGNRKMFKFDIDNDKLPFDQFINKIAICNKSIYCDGYYTIKEKNDLMQMFKKSIKNNTIKYKNLEYQQQKGIPQGSILSTILCNLFFAQLDKTYFNKIITKGIILRYVDDFLIVTTEKQEIKNFIKNGRLLTKYGVQINYDKLSANYDLKENNEECVNEYVLKKQTKKASFVYTKNKNIDLEKELNYNKSSTFSGTIYKNKIEEKENQSNDNLQDQIINDESIFSNKIKSSLPYFENSILNKKYFISQNFNYEKFIKDQTNYVTWCGIKIYGDKFGVKQFYNDNLNYTYVLDDKKPGKKFKEKMFRMLDYRLSYIFISKTNKYKYNVIYEALLFIYKRIINVFKRLPFQNKKYIEKLTHLCYEYAVVKSKKAHTYRKIILEKINEKALKRSFIKYLYLPDK